MTLNPQAEVFVPSAATLRLLENNTVTANGAKNPATNYEYPPPELESLYLNPNQTEIERETSIEPASQAIDYTNIDLPFFFHDMITADGEDFENYLSDRSEYLLLYAQASDKHATEVIDSLFASVMDLLRKDKRECKRPLELAAEMCDMDRGFKDKLLQKVVHIIEFVRTQCRPEERPIYALHLALTLDVLHIGTCVPLSKFHGDISRHICKIFTDALSVDFSRTVFALEQCHLQLAAMLGSAQLDALCATLNRISRFFNTDIRSRLFRLQELLRRGVPHTCYKEHAMPVAEMNEEEVQDYIEFLRASQNSISRCGS